MSTERPINRAMLYLLAALVGAGLLWGLMQFLESRDDDGRPPIIVSNGSVELSEESFNTKGSLRKRAISGGRSGWEHDHTNKPVNQIDVEVYESGCQVGGPYVVANFLGATIVYTSTTATRTVNFRALPVGSSGKVRLVFDVDAKSAQTLKAPDRLEVDGVGWHVSSIHIQSGSGRVECKFDYDKSQSLTLVRFIQ